MSFYYSLNFLFERLSFDGGEPKIIYFLIDQKDFQQLAMSKVFFCEINQLHDIYICNFQLYEDFFFVNGNEQRKYLSSHNSEA